jgi:hypothetical protein
MPDIDAWTGNSFPLADWIDVDRGVDTARLIADKSTSITVIRGGVAQAAQTVRIEDMGRTREVQTEGGQTAIADTLILGYFGHPTITDTDLQTGDRFAVASVGYEIVGLLPGLTDSLQAWAIVRS